MLILLRQESFRKASIICPECEIETLGDFAASAPEQLSAQLSRLKQRLQHESQRSLMINYFHSTFFLLFERSTIYSFCFRADTLNLLMNLEHCVKGRSKKS